MFKLKMSLVSFLTVSLILSATALESEYVIPEIFGNYSLKDLMSASSCGTVMATYNTIQAKSNGQYQGTGNSCGDHVSTGYQYQCVEYVQRYFNTLYKTTPNWYTNANGMCSAYPSGISKSSTPAAGYAVVFNWGTYGHTAMITKVSGSSLYVVEQNASPDGTNIYSTSSGVMCYLKYSGSSTGTCPNLGYYCGDDGLNKDPNTLYYCSGAGATPVAYKTCSNGCYTAPSGTDDYCSPSGSCPNLGYYCGDDGLNKDPNTLYYCSGAGATPVAYKTCSNGCYTASSGKDDYCL